MKTPVHKIAVGDLIRRRKVWTTIHPLSKEGEETLRSSSIEVVFSGEFLDNVKEPLDRSVGQLRDARERAKNSLKLMGIMTFDQLLSLRYETIATAPGMGAASMALILDVVAVFGLIVQGVPGMADTAMSADVTAQAKDLAKILGFEPKEEKPE